MSVFKYIQLLLIFTLPQALAGQTYYYKNYTVDDGLPSSETFRVIQDSKGFIWIATNQGVSLYNGYAFKNFDIQNGLPNNTTLDIYEDSNGRIWFISINGEISWFENDSIYQFPFNSKIIEYNRGGFGFPQKSNFYIDSLGNAYIGFNFKPLIRVSTDGSIKEFDSKDKNQLTVTEFNNKALFSSRRTISKNIKVIPTDNEPFTITGEFINSGRSILSRLNDNYILALSKNLFTFNRLGNVQQKTFTNEVVWISDDNEGNIWLGFLWGGAIAYSNMDFDRINHRVLEKLSVSSIFQDREGAYWATTLENGLYYFPSLKVKSFTESSGIKAKSITQVEAFLNEIWFGGNSKQLYQLSGDTLRVNLSLINSQTQCSLLKSYNDSLIISSYGTDKHLINILHNKEFIFEYKDKALLFAANDALMINNNTFFIFNRFALQVNLRGYIENRLKSPMFNAIYCAEKIKTDTIWMGTDKGLFELSLKTNELKALSFSPILQSRINCIEKTQLGTVWIGTKGAGLLQIKGAKVAQFTTKHGLPSNSINSINSDSCLLWVATNNGLGKINTNSNDDLIINDDLLELDHFTRANGLMNNEVFDFALLDSMVYVGTNNGLSYFNQNISGKNTASPPIYITGIKVMGSHTPVKSHYSLPYNQNYIEFSYIGLSYQRETPIVYHYMLEGIDQNWHTTENTSVQYPNLSPGNYIFKVKAFNRSGISSEYPASISFKIKKAFYQTIWFQVLLYTTILLITASIFTFFYLLKVRELKKRNLLISEINKFRQRALSAQMNPHFIYNSLNSVQSYILRNEPQKSSTYLSKFGNLMRRILENSQHPLITLHEEMEALRIYLELESMRFHGSFQYHIVIEDGIHLKNIKVPPLIIQPYVENAIHHGLRMKEQAGNLWIKIVQHNGRVIIIVEDDGVGRKEALRVRQQSKNTLKSYGTDLTSKRLSLFKELYKNDVSVNIIDMEDNGVAKGTKVEIVLLCK